MFIAQNNKWMRTLFFDEVSLVPFPHVDKITYSKEVNRLTEVVRAGKVYKTEKMSKYKTRQDTNAIQALGRIDAYEVVPELSEILGNTNDKELRDKIITVFGMFSRGVDPHSLEPFLNQENAITAVGEIHHPESGAILLDYVRKKNNSSDLSTEKKASLALALARQNQIEEAAGIIEEIIGTEDKIPYSIGIALDLLPVESSKRLLNQYLEKRYYEYYHVIKESLRKNCDENIAGNILNGLVSKKGSLSSDLIEILSGHINKSHIPLLIEGSRKEHDVSMRSFCLYMLGKLKAKEGIPVAEDASSDANWVIKVNGICALGQIGDSSAIPIIKKVEEDENFVVRSAAAWSIAKLGIN
jgi:HEAT repeat protein